MDKGADRRRHLREIAAAREARPGTRSELMIAIANPDQPNAGSDPSLANLSLDRIARAEWVSLTLRNQGRTPVVRQVFDPQPLWLSLGMERVAEANAPSDHARREQPVRNQRRDASPHGLATNEQARAGRQLAAADLDGRQKLRLQ